MNQFGRLTLTIFVVTFVAAGCVTMRKTRHSASAHMPYAGETSPSASSHIPHVVDSERLAPPEIPRLDEVAPTERPRNSRFDKAQPSADSQVKQVNAIQRLAPANNPLP